MPKPLQGHGRYMPGLDGLRALAVFAVILYHLNVNWAPGGLLGVGVFFVLSGYLITDILISQWKQRGKIDLKDFWIRRAKRLLPAMIVMLIAVVVWLALFDRAQLQALRGEIVAALLYVSNWWLVFHEVSYFESFGPASPFGHFWSLAVEEQFYLIWPLLLLLGLRNTPRRGKLLGLTLAGVVVSAFAMALLYEPGVDPSRIYYGTDTRAFGLLIGAALAMVWPSSRLSETVSLPARITLEVLGIAGLSTILWMIWYTNQYEDFLYQGGLVLLSIATAVVVAVIAHPASSFGKLMGAKPLRWIGVRSYGMYLWHYPIIVLSTPAIHTNGTDIPKAIFQIGATIALAGLSLRLVEEPIRRGSFAKPAKYRRMQDGRWRFVLFGRWVVSMVAILVFSSTCIAIAGWGGNVTASSIPVASTVNTESKQQIEQPNAEEANLFIPKKEDAALGETPDRTEEKIKEADKTKTTASSTQKNNSSQQELAKQDTSGKHNAAQSAADGEQKPAKSEEKQSETTTEGDEAEQTKSSKENESGSSARETDKDDSTAHQSKENSSKEEKPSKTDTEERATPSTKAGKGITVFGDSIMLDVAPHLQKLLPGITIDAKVGRQLRQTPELVAQYKKRGKLGNRVVLELGTNGAFTKIQLESLLKSLGDEKQIILVNTRVPRPWESVVNATLAEVANSHSNTLLVDWYTASAGKDSYFSRDGVHLEPEGAKAFAALLSGVLK
ncbi:acyltransferase family protein [Brevibacillus laterosporus]|uniref:acyltransferase family protein n=1 Tax=Brevibacillus laterosporus TaxID=1465 RepID=UPI003D258CBC